MRTTQRKGDIATARAIATFTKMGFDVSIPLTESAAYDLVVDDGEALRRVQCKYCGAARAQVDLRQIHSNSRGYVVKLTPAGAYDWLYILAADGSEYLIKESLHERRSITIRSAYQLGAVAESG
jgi:PD-(D/E)XK endonuclease